MIKTAVIIPLYNQSKYWDRMITALRKQSIRPDIIYLIVDRPQDDKGPLNASGEPEYEHWDAVSYIQLINEKTYDLNVEIHQIPTIPSNINRKNPFSTFLTGMARNIGTEKALRDGCDVLIFIDGDCIPQPSLVESHVKKCSQTEIPILTTGRRREKKYRWKDQRETIPNLAHLQIFRKEGMLINSPDLLKKCLIVWSCNVALNRKAVNLIRKFNEKYYKRLELFNSDFLGTWGGEDSFLGVQAWACRVFITTIGELSSGVEHIDHPRPSNTHTIDHKEFFEDQCNILNKKVTLNPLDIDFWC